MGGGLESRCVGRVYSADGAVRVALHHPHRTHDLRSGSQDHHPSKNSVQKTIPYNSTSNVPDHGRMYPKPVELRIYQYNYLVASSWQSTLFHEKGAGQTMLKLSQNLKGNGDYLLRIMRKY